MHAATSAAAAGNGQTGDVLRIDLARVRVGQSAIDGQVAGRRTGSVFIENGRFHGNQIAAALAERLGAPL